MRKLNKVNNMNKLDQEKSQFLMGVFITQIQEIINFCEDRAVLDFLQTSGNIFDKVYQEKYGLSISVEEKLFMDALKLTERITSEAKNKAPGDNEEEAEIIDFETLKGKQHD